MSPLLLPLPLPSRRRSRMRRTSIPSVTMAATAARLLRTSLPPSRQTMDAPEQAVTTSRSRRPDAFESRTSDASLRHAGAFGLHIRACRSRAPCAVAALARGAPAEAGYRLGIGEQRPEMFADAGVAGPPAQAGAVRRAVGLEPVRLAGLGRRVHDRRPRAPAGRPRRLHAPTVGCYDGRRYSRARACRAPSARAYRAAVRAFDDAYPWVRTYSAWNEVNHVSQPTFGRPRLAVRYYAVLRREARLRHFRVLAADVLDTSNMRRLPAGVPPPRARPSAPVGAAQLPGRQPPHLGRHARDARASSPAASG